MFQNQDHWSQARKHMSVIPAHWRHSQEDTKFKASRLSYRVWDFQKRKSWLVWLEKNLSKCREGHEGVGCWLGLLWDRVSLGGPGCPGTPSRSACLSLLSAGIEGVCHYAQPQTGSPASPVAEVVLELVLLPLPEVLDYKHGITDTRLEKQVLMGWHWQLGCRQVKFHEPASKYMKCRQAVKWSQV